MINKENFVMVSNNLLSTTNLNSTEKLFVSYLIGWQKQGLVCRMTNRKLAKHFGMKYAGFRSMLNKLNKYKFFETKQFGNTVEDSKWTSGHEIKVDEDLLNEFLTSEKPKNKVIKEVVTVTENSDDDVNKQTNDEFLNKAKQDVTTAKLEPNKLINVENKIIIDDYLPETQGSSENQSIEVIDDKETNPRQSMVDNLDYVLANVEHKSPPYIVPEFKHHVNDMVELNEILLEIGFDFLDISYFLDYYDFEDKVLFKDLIKYIISLRKEQKYNDYDGVEITDRIMRTLKDMIIE